MPGGDKGLKIKVPGVKIGHADDRDALTGCTVILCEQGAVCGIDKRGGGTTTRQADAFEPWHVVQRVHGVLLTGGSAFGLGALSGVLRYLEERQIGFDMGIARIPIAAAAGLFDLGIGSHSVRPDPEMAYRACLKATSNQPEEGCVGAGMGASAGKMLGMDFAMKSGVGWSSISFGAGLAVAAIVAVNPGGDVIDPATGQIVAGVRSPSPGSERSRSTYFADAQVVLKNLAASSTLGSELENTVIGVILTNAALSKSQATKVAQMAHDGLARSIRPAHTMYDGDTIFTLATGGVDSDVNIVGSIAAEAFSEAVIRAATTAISMGGLPAAADVPES